MERRMKITALLGLVLLCQTVLAQQSQLELGLDSDGRMLVTSLFDDDGSIESLEIFVLEEGIENRFHYDNVLEGQVLGISVQFGGVTPEEAITTSGKKENEKETKTVLKENSNETKAVFAGGEGRNLGIEGVIEDFSNPDFVYYNFLDADGEITNSKFFVYIAETPKEPEIKNINRAKFFHPLTSKAITARKEENTGNYFVDVKITGNRIDSAAFEYYFSSPVEKQRLELASLGEGVFGGTIGPLNGKTSIESKVIAISNGFDYEYLFGKREFGFVSTGGQGGQCSGFYNTYLKNNSLHAASEAFLQAQNFRFSGIKIVEDEENPDGQERTFRVTRVSDDGDQKIDFVEFIAETPSGETRQFKFSGVGAGDEMTIETPPDSMVYYNFMDFTQKDAGINYFFPVKKRDVLEMPFFTASDKADLLVETRIEAVPVGDCTSFNLKVKATTNGAESRVYLKYGFSENDMPFFAELGNVNAGVENPSGGFEGKNLESALLQGETEYGYEAGPFGNETGFYAVVFAENEEGQVDRMGGVNQWIGFLEPQEQPTGVEICGNGIDDDLDEEIDEDCLFLPDLFFASTGISDLFVRGEDNIVSATVKNGGLSDAGAFEVGFYINDSLVSLKTIEGLLEGEETLVEIGFVPPETTVGETTARLVVDPTDSITELDELNNEAIKQVVVGKNSFRVALNFNDTSFLGDTRQIRVFDASGLPVGDAGVEAILPSGKTKTAKTGSDGIASFALEESGAYSLKVAKNGFEEFDGAFRVPGVVLEGLKTQYGLGEQLQVSISTDEGQKIENFTATIMTPLSETKTFSSGGYFQLSAPGSYRLEITRNNVKIAQATFVVSGFVESVVFEGILSSLLGGELIKDTPLFVFILLLAAIAAYLVFSRQELLFGEPRYDTTSQKRLRLVAKIITVLASFFLPFVVARFFGFNAAAIVAIGGILAVLFLEFRAKNARKRKPFGF